MIKFKKTLTRNDVKMDAVLKDSISFLIPFNKESKKWEADFEYNGGSVYISVSDTDSDGSKNIRKLTDKVTIVDVELKVERSEEFYIHSEEGFLEVNLISERTQDRGRYCRLSVSEWVFGDLDGEDKDE